LTSFQAGCVRALSDAGGVVTECILPEDQLGTISGRWPVLPVPVALADGQYSSDDSTAITSAADSWNEFYSESMGTTLLNYGDGGANSSSKSRPDSICAEGIVSGEEYSGEVVVYKDGDWDYDSDIIALTTFCPIPDDPYPRIYMGVMELNYQYFFVSGQKLPDLESIMLHEFGHLIGLNHSCETTEKADTPDCTVDNLESDYYYAVMFPIIFFPDDVSGEQRRVLQDNDMGRANCLYEDIISASEEETDDSSDDGS